METEHKALQLLGSLLIAMFATMLFGVRYVASLNDGWRDAIVFTGLYLFVTVVVRMLAVADVVGQVDARVVNGLVAGAFASGLLTSLVALKVGTHGSRS